MHPLIKAELDNLQLQFGAKTTLTLDDYATLYGIDRRNASQHLRRRKIPYSKEGKGVYISLLDLATYKARCKCGNKTPLNTGIPNYADEMKRRRGFSQKVEQRQLTN